MVHRSANGRVDGPEVLADDRGAVALGLDGDDREKLLERGPDVDAVGCRRALGDAVEALQPEHVVDSEHRRDAQVMLEGRAEQGVP